MPFPAHLTRITVTGTYQAPDGRVLSGSVGFRLSAPAGVPADSVVIPQDTVWAQIDPTTGLLSVALAATDDPHWNVTGLTYQVTERIDGMPAGAPYNIAVPAASPNGTLNLASVAQTTPPPVQYSYVLASTVTAKGDLLVATGPNAVTREPVGADGLVLTTDSTQPAGIGWKSPSGGVPTGRLINTTAPLAGGGDLSADLTLTVANATSGAKGVLQLAGDLGGTAASPTVPGLASRMTYRGSWAPSTVYAANNVVTIGGELLICTTAHTSGTGFTLANWSILSAGPHVFNIIHYGAVGDGRVVNDGAMASGSATLTSATGPFTAADPGKAIMVKGAGPTGVTTLVTTIQTYISPTQVTLAAANASGGAVSGAYVLWATDDTAAVQAAINAAQAYGTAHGFAQVYVPTAPGAFYGIAGPLIKGGSTKGNAQLTIAPVDPAVNKVTLEFAGAGDGSSMFHWNQHTPELTTSALVSFGVYSSIAAQTSDIGGATAINGNGALLGGPNQGFGYGTSALLFSNMLVVLRNLSLVTTYSSYGLTYSAADFSGLAQANIFDVSVGVAATYNDLQSPNPLSSGQSIGILMPANGNNDNNAVRNLTFMGGYTRALYATEHTVIHALRVLYCWAAAVGVGAYFGSVGASHDIEIYGFSCEGCVRHVMLEGSGQSGVGPTIIVLGLDTEGTPIFYDGSNGGNGGFGLGKITYTGFNPVSVPNRTGVKMENLIQQPGWVAPPAFTSGTPFINPFWRDATVTLAGVADVAVGKASGSPPVAALGGSTPPTMQSLGITSGTIRVPSGGWIAITGTPTTHVWVLD